jgi:hypothetical protein
VECGSPFCHNCGNISDFEEENVTEEITNTGGELGFYGQETEDILKLLSSHSEELTDDYLLLLDEQRAFEEAGNDTKE